ncbi:MULTISPECIES: DNA mismatch repair endonuclease MutL [Fusobacterium]|uniref:DNA mismatch repair protein MutL n=1 Tax=Fusobacterium mortiferum ATCC 9817 TaxID=469616 RepID=A0ABN5JBI5_FUSMR|nr:MULTISPECIES: DNA mismatch repair endonuclease MutL [Fusobacterium]AVQ19808.1 DNA mismatch repair endonuclease MutL [Fusobacterium mortiferum ATCC 9817]EEO35755.2 DNA mismatch repair domain protein [Fusobacterium mortiferum ATCC 9817]MCF2628806.1 DNA mismatch repair endonuclease MutL [Fusobacterium mortiferum]MCF2698484.1 DNA mismatch repair endonuclease MutL [Fusobacterium mortiferum]MCI6382026.1 DNA mismatch repair endonuclease MutL [Fusobacterium mortiferum]
MGKIKILDESVSNIIAAGEVVENPASMIKELLENSLDAESKSIRIEVKNGGRDVAIIDDGVGMSQDDLLLSIERHATSKISKKDDLYNLYTYGFRGEALSSISAVSKMSISSRVEESEVGSQITVLGGKVTSLKDVQRNRGTTIEIKELFFNTPARLKFLRKPSTEYINIKDIIIQEALSNPDVAIMLILDGKVSIKTSGNGLDNAIVEIFGKNVLKNMKKFKLGYLGNGAIYRSTKDSIFTFVNNRMVKSKIVESAVIDGYYTKLMKGKYPFAIIFLDINPKDVDVNVHPSKKIVKFADEEEVYNYVLKEIEKTFARDDDFVSPTLQEKIEKEESKFLDFSEFEKFTPMKSEPQQFQELLEEEKDIEEEIFGEKREKLQEKDILREEFEEKKEYEVIEDKRIEKEIVREENIEFNTESSSKNKIPLDIYEEKVKTSEITVKKVEEKSKKIEFRVIGQVFGTFILVERDGVFEIYDQHIVHERILYEKLKAQYYGTKVSMQQLLVPIRILVDPRERELIFEEEENFTKAGFEIDRFSDNEILIRAVPMLDLRDSIENIFREILKNIKENRNIDIRESILISMSCKGAIKANEKLNHEEMERIVRELHEIGEYTCPHGRPIITKITRDDLEKLFKRK